MRIAICPGSYDPVTIGHLNIIERATKLFDKVIVLAMVNPDKHNVFTTEERVDMLRRATADMPDVEVDFYAGLVADYARERGALALVKGLRAVSDFDYEFQMAMINKKLNPALETVFISTDTKYLYLSSSAVRQIAMYDGALSDFVPPQVEQMIRDRLCLKGAKEE